MRKPIVAALTALLLAGGGLATAAPAFATPPEGAGNDPVSICHSGDGVHFEYIAPDGSGAANGHQHHDADQFGLSEADCLALNPAPEPEPEPEPEQPQEPEVPDVDYVTAAWLVPGGSGSIWEPDQVLATSVETEEPDLSALDGFAFAECSYYQIDVYVDNETTDALLAGGILRNPNDPPEALIPGGEGTAWKFVQTDCPPPPTVQVCDAYSTVHTTDLGTWSWADTRATGHYALAEAGLHIWTEGATSTDKVAGYYAVNHPLSAEGADSIASRIDYDAAFGLTPGLQIVTDFDADGTADGILVGEAVYGDSWWLSNSAAQFAKDGAPNTGGGYGSSWYGTLNEWLAEFPDANVVAIGFSLGSGVHGDGVIDRLTFGCVNYTFGAPAAPAEETRQSSTEGEPDCEAGTVTTTTTFEARQPLAWDEASQSYPWGEWEVTGTEETSREATAEECPPPTVPEEPEQPQLPDTLAYTGMADPFGPMWVALAIMVLGALASAAAVVVTRRRTE